MTVKRRSVVSSHDVTVTSEDALLLKPDFGIKVSVVVVRFSSDIKSGLIKPEFPVDSDVSEFTAVGNPVIKLIKQTIETIDFKPNDILIDIFRLYYLRQYIYTNLLDGNLWCHAVAGFNWLTGRETRAE